MAINLDKPDRWKRDIALSVDQYNAWFMRFAPQAFRETRVLVTEIVRNSLIVTDNLKHIGPEVLRQKPDILPTLRMSTCPPLARDRLIGLAGLPKSMIDRMEKGNSLPVQLSGESLDRELTKIGVIIEKLADRDIFSWLDTGNDPTEAERLRAATIVADRLCGATTDPIIRNAQEERQLNLIRSWLEHRGYHYIQSGNGIRFNEIPALSFTFHHNIPVKLNESGQKSVNIPVDVVVMRKHADQKGFPFLIEAKSAGDFTNVNKRRKEEAKKVEQLRRTYGPEVEYALFLCGYFDSGYLGYEAAEGIDWVWEHRIDDLELFGL